MKTLIPNNKIIKLVLSLTVGTLLLYFIFLFLVLKEKAKVESAYRDAESTLSKEEMLWKIKSFSERNAKEIEVVRKFFVAPSEEVKFIEEIEKIGDRASVLYKINSIEVELAQNEPFKEDVLIKMSLEGSWVNVFSFIEELEKMPFGVSIINLNLDADTPGFWSGKLEFLIFKEK